MLRAIVATIAGSVVLTALIITLTGLVYLIEKLVNGGYLWVLIVLTFLLVSWFIGDMFLSN